MATVAQLVLDTPIWGGTSRASEALHGQHQLQPPSLAAGGTSVLCSMRAPVSVSWAGGKPCQRHHEVLLPKRAPSRLRHTSFRVSSAADGLPGNSGSTVCKSTRCCFPFHNCLQANYPWDSYADVSTDIQGSNNLAPGVRVWSVASGRCLSCDWGTQQQASEIAASYQRRGTPGVAD
jgi:hypothetical protein